MCNGYFGDNNIPIAKLRKDVEILRIAPTSSKCVNVGSDGETRCELVENQLTLGPIYKVASYMICSLFKIECSFSNARTQSTTQLFYLFSAITTFENIINYTLKHTQHWTSHDVGT